MPQLDGRGVVRLLEPDRTPLVAFVTAHDEHAVKAFDLDAVDYLPKPVARARLGATVDRAWERLARDAGASARGVNRARPRPDTKRRSPAATSSASRYGAARRSAPARGADRHGRGGRGAAPRHHPQERAAHLTYRLKNLEARLDPARFVRLSRSALANLRLIARFSPMPGGTYLAILANRQEVPVSRTQGRVLRDRLMRL
jgi:two-component system LytT family response regulator